MGSVTRSLCPLQVHVGLHRSEEHTSELQSRLHLVCRLLLEKKKTRQPASLRQPYLSQQRTHFLRTWRSYATRLVWSLFSLHESHFALSWPLLATLASRDSLL